ncbi:CPBP family intramembrane glutamic endopeptidase [Pedobacter antarcticus]|uniref:CPBP family intramembrane glutamic endopeptidase n=1 Tax=Pedobacter antarcticus TaxID=34086 RepID=UPI00292F8063|nr:CPBP family intramembrane glutamic endopeptidase [Pedobacter antarcticus]
MDKKLIPAIITFYCIAIALRYLTNGTLLLSKIDNTFLKIILQGIGPAIGAVVTFLLFKIPSVMTLKGNFRNLYFPLFIFWMFPAAIISAIAFLKNGTVPFGLVFPVLFYGLLEEMGWRGFLQQVLKPLPRYASILVVALLWFMWHLNFEITVANLTFFGILILGSWGIGKIADKTNSLLAAAAFHSLNNFYQNLDTIKIITLTVLIIIWVLTVIFFTRNQNAGFKRSPTLIPES